VLQRGQEVDQIVALVAVQVEFEAAFVEIEHVAEGLRRTMLA
jgi:hypothetical protein